MNIRILFYLFVFVFISTITGQTTKADWTTFFEKSNFLSTPSYKESIKYFMLFEKYSPYAKMVNLGKSPQGRDIYSIIISKEKAFTTNKMKKTNKPLLLINNGIHAGEIEGKDASMLLLREILITKEKENLLDHCNIILIPIFNVDGHERISEFNRINQNGPKEMGWRTTSQNLNLNRDFMKADAPEMKLFLKLFNEWLPDFFIDTHTTNGVDFQYQITYGIEKNENIFPETATWIRNKFIPFIEKRTDEQRFLILPYVGFKEGDYKKGLVDWISGPRFSHGYSAVHNRPGLLIETHMLKPYKDRVFATKALITATLEIINKNSKYLIEINRKADSVYIQNFGVMKNPYPIDFKINDDFELRKYKGLEAIDSLSWITGTKVKQYTSEKFELDVPYYSKAEISKSVSAPDYYVIPREYAQLVEILKLHGVKVEAVSKSKNVMSENYRFTNVKFPQRTFEGCLMPDYEIQLLHDTVRMNAGDFIVDPKQRTIGIIIHLLEPISNDSFVKWGFMNSIFEQKEYFEEYSMEPIARKMAESNPQMKNQFLNKLESDEKFRNNPRQRLNYFYEKSPYYDKQLNLYPIHRVVGEIN